MAVQYLTIVPVPGRAGAPAARLGRAVVWFPVVGALLGVVVALGERLASAVFPSLLAALLTLTAWKLVTGGLHLDGLADCLDGLVGRDREHRLAIMRDSRIGTFGAVGLVFVLMLELVAIAEIPPAVHVAIGRMFGELHMHPAAPQMPGYPEVFVIHAHRDSQVANGEFWHSDVSCDEVPPLGTMLQIHVLPEIGGDTLFANMYTAFDALSAPMKRMLEGLTARHESEHVYRGRYSDRGVDDTGRSYPHADHPVVRTHPETGRKALFVNRTFTTRINGLTESESRAVLALLFDHCEQVDFQIRFRWERNDDAVFRRDFGGCAKGVHGKCDWIALGVVGHIVSVALLPA